MRLSSRRGGDPAAKELIQQYQEKRASLNADIDRILAQITDILGIDITEESDE